MVQEMEDNLLNKHRLGKVDEPLGAGNKGRKGWDIHEQGDLR